MRLWHIDLIPYLPKSQVSAQWRELNSIFKKQDKHILINYIYDYDKYYLKSYSLIVMGEMVKRHYKINIDNYARYFGSIEYPEHYVREDWFYLVDSYINGYDVIHSNKLAEHNDEYLLICFMNLYEKYIRGQKDFDSDTFNKLYDFVNKTFDLKSLGIKKENL